MPRRCQCTRRHDERLHQRPPRPRHARGYLPSRSAPASALCGDLVLVMPAVTFPAAVRGGLVLVMPAVTFPAAVRMHQRRPHLAADPTLHHNKRALSETSADIHILYPARLLRGSRPGGHTFCCCFLFLHLCDFCQTIYMYIKVYRTDLQSQRK